MDNNIQIRPIYPILGVVIGFLLARSQQKSGAPVWLYAIVGGVVAYVLAFVLLGYVLNDMLQSVKNMTPAQADNVAASICQFEKDVAFFKANNQKTIDNPFGYDKDIADLEARIATLRDALATANYTYQDCKAVKNGN